MPGTEHSVRRAHIMRSDLAGGTSSKTGDRRAGLEVGKAEKGD